jgi:hypothetical protein
MHGSVGSASRVVPHVTQGWDSVQFFLLLHWHLILHCELQKAMAPHQGFSVLTELELLLKSDNLMDPTTLYF